MVMVSIATFSLFTLVKRGDRTHLMEFINVDAAFSKDIENIFAQNAAWKEAQEKKDPDFFDKLGAVTKPSYMWIGCADARVPANEIMGRIAGSVFVARNFGNLVVATDFNLMSALQYAVTYLNVNHIIVCGHYDCSGVRLAETRNDHIAPLESWLRNIRDVYVFCVRGSFV